MVLEIRIPVDSINFSVKDFTYDYSFSTIEMMDSPIQEMLAEIRTSLSDYSEYKSYNHTMEKNQAYRFF